MKILFLSLIVSINAIAQSKITMVKLAEKDIPQEIKIFGKLKEAYSWNDISGENIVITSETGEYENIKSEIDGRSAELFAFRFIRTEKAYQQKWKIYDYIKDCPVDIEASFIKNTLKITDINNNGIAEIWIMYKTACHGDVSPCEMKIIMYEGNSKFAMRGENRVQISKTEFFGGTYKFDKAFNESGKEIKEFAKVLWKKNINQNWQ
jgi:hypothetical protein